MDDKRIRECLERIATALEQQVEVEVHRNDLILAANKMQADGLELAKQRSPTEERLTEILEPLIKKCILDLMDGAKDA